MKRILSLDGGGIRGVFSLGSSSACRSCFRAEYDSRDLVSADQFDLFGGYQHWRNYCPCLCWGMPVEEILERYVKYAGRMFGQFPGTGPLRSYSVRGIQAKPLSELLSFLSFLFFPFFFSLSLPFVVW